MKKTKTEVVKVRIDSEAWQALKNEADAEDRLYGRHLSRIIKNRYKKTTEKQ